MSELKSAEEVAKEIVSNFNHKPTITVCAVEPSLKAQIAEAIKADRSRLIAYLREKMPKEREYSEDNDESVYDVGFNDAIEAMERLMKEVQDGPKS